MAVVRTRTATKTFTRVSLMKMQIDRVLTRSRVSSDYIRRILRGVDNRWIAEISVYAIDGAEACWCELFMRIDWSRNEIHVADGRDAVTIDSRWTDDIAVEVEKALGLFEDYANDHDLRILVHTRYRSEVDREAANRTLGFVNAEPVRWAGGMVGSAMTVPELDEFTVGINIIDQ